MLAGQSFLWWPVSWQPIRVSHYTNLLCQLTWPAVRCQHMPHRENTYPVGGWRAILCWIKQPSTRRSSLSWAWVHLLWRTYSLFQPVCSPPVHGLPQGSGPLQWHRRMRFWPEVLLWLWGFILWCTWPLYLRHLPMQTSQHRSQHTIWPSSRWLYHWISYCFT